MGYLQERRFDKTGCNCEELDAIQVSEEIEQILNREKCIVLSTSFRDYVTSRTMSHVNIGLDIYFQTDMNFIKYQQIVNNPNVALCTGNMQVEGKAKIIGHPLDESNKQFLCLYKEKYPGSYEKYSSIKDEVVIKVTPSLFILWKYIDGKPCREFLIPGTSKAYREYYGGGE